MAARESGQYWGEGTWHVSQSAAFQHETNTFAPMLATFEEFEKHDAWPGLVRGPALFDAVAGINLPVVGFMAAARAAGHDLVPLSWCSAEPSSFVTRDAFERITAMLCDDLAALGPFDGVYLDLHGAMVAEEYEDGEGETLRRVRAVVGGRRTGCRQPRFPRQPHRGHGRRGHGAQHLPHLSPCRHGADGRARLRPARPGAGRRGARQGVPQGAVSHSIDRPMHRFRAQPRALPAGRRARRRGRGRRPGRGIPVRRHPRVRSGRGRLRCRRRCGPWRPPTPCSRR